jgi:hypothetical protein
MLTGAIQTAKREAGYAMHSINAIRFRSQVDRYKLTWHLAIRGYLWP